MSLEQEPTLGEIMRGQARIELALNTFIADTDKRDHAFRNALSANNVAIALHTQKLIDLSALEAKVDKVTASANKIAGAWALLAIIGAWLVAWFKHS